MTRRRSPPPPELRRGIEGLGAPRAPRSLIETVVQQRAQGARARLPDGEAWAPPAVRPAVLAAAALMLMAGLVGLRQWMGAGGEGRDPIERECRMSAEGRSFVAAGSLFFLAAACATEPSAPPPPVSTDAVRSDMLRPGVWVYEGARWEDGVVRDVTSRDSFALERVPGPHGEAWRSVGEMRLTNLPVISRDTIWLDERVRPIRQVWYYQRGRTGRTVMDLSYQGDSATGFFQDAAGNAEWHREVRLALPGPTVILPSYSLSGLAHALASIPLSAGWSGTFQSVLNWRPPARTTISLEVVGEERVTVPAGTFECWRLQVVGTRDGRLWVSKAGQLLVKSSDGAAGYELESVLVSYSPPRE